MNDAGNDMGKESGISKQDQVLAGLALSLQAAALQQLGKITNPLTKQVERDLAQARATIDILEMLKDKCRQGTHKEIVRMLDTAVFELQMNYLDEVKKDKAGEKDQTEEKGQAGEEEQAEEGDQNGTAAPKDTTTDDAGPAAGEADKANNPG